ncbi:MAG: hypothetical protein KBS94_08730 [Prevotella sp.]|nr:hypothetical protein [Candidatus Equicola faecalis]
MKVNFYRCPVCGNIIVKMFDGGAVPVCCGKPMMLLEANTTDGKTEYHVPVIEKVDDRRLRVKIGKEPHPMKKEHYIQFIFVETCSKQGKHAGRFVWLKPEDTPQCTFCVCTEDVVNVYEYCNVHGLWQLMVTGFDESKKSADDEVKGDAEKCGVYPAFCGECPKDPREAYYSCD